MEFGTMHCRTGRVMRTDVCKRDVLAGRPNVGWLAQRKDRVWLLLGKSSTCPGRNIKFNPRLPIGNASPAASTDLNQIWLEWWSWKDGTTWQAVEECSIKCSRKTGSWGRFQTRRDLSDAMGSELLHPSPFSTGTLRLLPTPISLIHWPPRPSDLYPPQAGSSRTFSRPRFRHHPGLQLGIPVGEVGKLLGTAGWKNVLEYWLWTALLMIKFGQIWQNVEEASMFGEVSNRCSRLQVWGVVGRMKRSRLLSVGRLSIVRGWLNTSSPLAAEIYRPSKRFTLTFPSSLPWLSCQDWTNKVFNTNLHPSQVHCSSVEQNAWAPLPNGWVSDAPTS